MFESSGPFPQFTFIYCHKDGVGRSKVAAFSDKLEAADHAKLQLLRLPDEWDSVVIGEGVEADIRFLGSWERDHEGALTWARSDLC